MKYNKIPRRSSQYELQETVQIPRNNFEGGEERKKKRKKKEKITKSVHTLPHPYPQTDKNKAETQRERWT